MSKTHNKKRNVGIIYEQLIGRMALATVENDGTTRDMISKLISNHFQKGTQLYKEFRLFNALAKTTVSSESLAVRILDEAKNAAKDHDAKKLSKEKSSLIREISRKLTKDFYSQNVENYRHYATIQTLLNDWRNLGRSDIARVAQYEQSLVEWLISKKELKQLNEMKSNDVDNLTVKIMTEKFNSRYGKLLNEEQKGLIQDYVFSMGEGDTLKFRRKLEEIRDKALLDLKKYSSKCENKVLNEKLESVNQMLLGVNVNNIDDDLIARYLTISRLRHELLENDNG